MNFCHMTYHRADDNMLETSIKTFRSVTDATLVVTTDDVPESLREELDSLYCVRWDVVEPTQMIPRRATCKIERLAALMERLEEGDGILVADVDTYFVADPLVPFEQHPNMDLGLTTRGYSYAFPINAGVFYLRVNSRTRTWIQWHLREIFEPRWHPYVTLKRQWNHYRFGLDWSVSQDFLIACWNERKKLAIHIEDAGPRYNYCPPTDLLGAKAADLIMEAYEKGTASILHLKSDLKQLIYEGRLPNCVTRHPRGKRVWA